jgi:hypothetical protein
MSKRGISGTGGWVKIGVVVGVVGLLVAAGQLYYTRESVRTPATMGRGGDGGGGTIIGNNGTIVGGPGGGAGVGGRGGDGGSGFVRGENGVIYGGEGGEAGQPDGRGGRGGRSGYEAAGSPNFRLPKDPSLQGN